MNAPVQNSAPLNVMAVIDDLVAACAPLCSAEQNAEAAAVRAAVAELIEADQAYDAALKRVEDLNRHIAERGWLELEHDSLSKALTEFCRAGLRRKDAVARIGGAP